MNSHDELMNLDYVAYDHVKHFENQIRERDFIEAFIDLGYRYNGDTPVLDVKATDIVSGEYSKRYSLDGMSIGTFEEAGYDLWTEAFNDSFEHVDPVGLLEE